MPKRKVVLNAEVDGSRAFPILVNYSNLTSHREGTAPMYLDDIVALRAQLPSKKGVYDTQGLNENRILHAQAGSGLVSDGVKYVRNKAGDLLQYGANHGIDYVADYSKGRVGSVAKRIRGGNFFRRLASGAVRGIGNIAADAIGGGANIRPLRRPAKVQVYRPELEMALQPQMEGSGILSRLASGAVRFTGNTIANAIGGGVKKRKRKGAKGAGLTAAGMTY